MHQLRAEAQVIWKELHRLARRLQDDYPASEEQICAFDSRVPTNALLKAKVGRYRDQLDHPDLPWLYSLLALDQFADPDDRIDLTIRDGGQGGYQNCMLEAEAEYEQLAYSQMPTTSEADINRQLTERSPGSEKSGGSTNR